MKNKIKDKIERGQGESSMRFKGSNYLSADASSASTALVRKRTEFSLKRILLAVAALIIGISIVLPQASFVAAYADDGDDGIKKSQETINESFNESKLKGNDDGLNKALDESKNVDPRSNTFVGVISRIFTMGYINDTRDSYPAPPIKGPDGKPRYNCDPNDPRNGTVLYHNCDIPTLATEIVQTLVAQISPPSKPTSASNQLVKSRTPLRALGLPSTLPEIGVPSDPSEREYKYTGMELYGYGLNYTSYNGEWDYVKTQTSARMLANFGLMDGFAMTGNTIMASVKGGVQEGSDRAMESLSKGQVFGAVFGFVTGVFEGSVSASLNSIIDTSERNIFTVDGWYRPGFGSTIYGGREKTSSELSFDAQKDLLDFIDKNPISGSVNATAPIDRGKTLLGKAHYQMGGGGETGPDSSGGIDCSGFILFSWNALGITRDKIGRSAQNQYDHLAGHDVAVKDIQPGDLLFYAGSRRGKAGRADGITHVAMYMGDNKIIESTRGTSQPDGPQINDLNTSKASFIGIRRIPSEWIDPSKAKEAGVNFQIDNILSAIVNFSKKSNWNKPYNRYVCKTPNGDEITAYNSKGDLNKNCLNRLRPPVQGGLFGSGYDDTDYYQQPTDTRRTVSQSTFMGLGFESYSGTLVSNSFLFITSMFVQISNIALNLSFSPPLETIGLTDIVVSTVEGFRDSIFFPLAVILAAGAALMAFYQTGVKKQYRAQMISLALIVATFLSGIIILSAPRKTIEAVDKVPAMMEATIIGGLYGFGNDEGDQLCSATGSTNNGGIGDKENLDGVKTSTNATTRTIMCENWRAFLFNPWVRGQWGAPYSSLYAKGHALDGGKTLNNTNKDLVGEAAVNMGGGTTVNNWALYQLDSTSIGTTTESGSENEKNNGLNPDFYRIIDAQAGPNNGAGTDGRYLNSWSGLNYVDRLGISFMSMPVAGIGSVVIVIYSFAKIAISLSVTLMIVFMPLIFALAMLPVFRRTLKAYAGTILSLSIQRVFYVLMLAVLFKILIGFQSTENYDYFSMSIISIIVCILFLMYRSEVFGLIQKGTDETMGSFANGRFFTPVEAVRNTSYVRRKMERNRLRVNTGGASMAANLMVNGHRAFTPTGMKSAKMSFNELSNQNQAILARRQMYRGVPGLMVAEQASKNVKSGLDKKYSGDSFEQVNKEIASHYDDSNETKFKNAEPFNIGNAETGSNLVNRVIREESSNDSGKPVDVQHISATINSDDVINPDNHDRRGARLTERANEKAGDLVHENKLGKRSYDRAEERMVNRNRKVARILKRKSTINARKRAVADRGFENRRKNILASYNLDHVNEANDKLSRKELNDFFSEINELEVSKRDKMRDLQDKKENLTRSVFETRAGSRAKRATQRYQEKLSDVATRRAIEDQKKWEEDLKRRGVTPPSERSDESRIDNENNEEGDE